jgi:uncharacterized membrane protein YidH (DUF202 family)
VPDDDSSTTVGEAWDEGLTTERTELAWGRTGLAVAVAVGVLARRVWNLGGGLEIAAMVVVGVGALVWLVGMRLSRDIHGTMAPHGLDGRQAFGLLSIGTLLLAVGGLVFCVVLYR